MTKKILFLFSCMMLAFSCIAQNKADDLVGYYFMTDPFSGEGSQVYIYKNAEGKYDGLVSWVENPEKKPFLNLVFLKGLTFNPKENEWQEGIIKYPGKKGTFKMYMKFDPKKGKNKLKVRGYWGVAMLGKTMYWDKETKKRIQD